MLRHIHYVVKIFQIVDLQRRPISLVLCVGDGGLLHLVDIVADVGDTLNLDYEQTDLNIPSK